MRSNVCFASGFGGSGRYCDKTPVPVFSSAREKSPPAGRSAAGQPAPTRPRSSANKPGSSARVGRRGAVVPYFFRYASTTGFMSIFQKDCPQCAAPNPANALRCPCGHCFDPEAMKDKRTAAEVAVHEERLYHDYLAARVVQAEATLEVARAEALAEPENTYKSAQALAAEQALHTARAELRQQAQKIARLKKSLPRKAHVARVEAPVTPAAPAPKLQTAKLHKPSVSAPAPMPSVHANSFRPDPKPDAPNAAIAVPPLPIARTAPPRAEPKSDVPNVAVTIPPAPMAQTAPSRAEPGPDAIRPVVAIPPAPTPPVAASAKKQRRNPTPSTKSVKPGRTPLHSASEPSRAFRAQQAKRANAVARKALASPAGTQSVATMPASITPIALERAAPKTPEVSTKECPNCTAKVPTQVPQCRCGFGFSAGSLEMASLTLDAAALAILRR